MNSVYWKAIRECDGTYDGVFWYGVKTTGIFCRPSCKSKLPKPSNVRIFRSADEAVKNGFRPCKRCRPDRMSWSGPHLEMAEQAAAWIRKNYDKSFTLQDISGALAVHPHYLHRVFRKQMGKTPAEYLTEIRLKAAREWLENTDKSLTEIALDAGFSSLSHFSRVFKHRYGLPPGLYRKKHEEEKCGGSQERGAAWMNDGLEKLCGVLNQAVRSG
jgi:AraC family transcriptional regulator, regulatory protein of adaptative response / methylphosphotriester-DNA alkyltransferase methyltransferase